MATTDYQNVDAALLTDDSSDAWGMLLIAGGYILIRQLPKLLDRAFNLASEFMSSGYALHMRKGDFELRIGNGKDVWEAEGNVGDSVATMPSEAEGNRLSPVGA